MPDIVEINVETGEVIERDFTEEEIAQRKKDEAEFKKAEKARKAEEKKAADTKASALAKLAALGLTEEEAKAIFGGN
jgi:dihydroxyacid dehydratase/phosphogluconate dehydratase